MRKQQSELPTTLNSYKISPRKAFSNSRGKIIKMIIKNTVNVGRNIYTKTIVKMDQDSDLEEDFVPQWVFDIQELPASEIKCDLNQNPVLEFTKETVVRRIYALGRILSQVFEKYKLHYWTCGGTTLGLLRHKGPFKI